MGLKNSIWFYSTALGVVVMDQVTKYIARQNLTLGKPVHVIPGFFDLNLSYNTGAAFSILPNWAPLFIIVGLVAIFAIVKLRSAGSGSLCVSVGLGLLLGGAIGNLIDRIAFPGLGVTDFIDFHIRIKGASYPWPTFNIADAAIVIGAILTLYHVYIIDKRRSDAAVELGSHEHDEQQTQD